MNRIGDNLIHVGENEYLVRELLTEQAKFIVVGGLAMAWHCSERQADDMDLLVEPTPNNSSRVASALSRLNLRGFDNDSFTRPGLQVPLKKIYYAELLTPEAEGLSYSVVESTAVEARLFGHPILLASPDTLLHMKLRAIASTTGAQREKHQRDIALLKGRNAA